MKQFIKAIFLLLLTSTMSFGQDIFIPTKPDNISEEDYRRGKEYLKNIYKQIADDNYNVVADDYWNFATSYYLMGQSKELIYDYLFKTKASDKSFFCEIVERYHKSKNGIENTEFYKLLGKDYIELVSDCSTYKAIEDKFDIDDYITKNN